MRTRFAKTLCAWALIAPLEVGCVLELEPEVGPLRTGLCQPEDSDEAHSVSFSQDILPLLSRPPGRAGCSCHRLPLEGPINAIEATGLELTSHETLMEGGARGAAVQAFDPCASNLYLKLSAGPPFGSRMPFDGPPYFTRAELALVHDWIAEGAQDN